MKRPSNVLRLIAALGIVSVLFTGLVSTAAASPTPGGGNTASWDGTSIPPLFGSVESDAAYDFGPFADGAQEVYFPAVGNGEDFGLGAAQTSITVQNIDANDAYIFIYVGNGGGEAGFTADPDMVTYLVAGASKTFTAADLGIAAGEIVPVVVAGYNQVGGVVCEPANDLNGDGDCTDQYTVDVAAVTAYVASVGGVANVTCAGLEAAGFYQEDAQYILQNIGGQPQLDADQNGQACDALATGPDETTTADVLVPVFMAGVAKQAVTGANLPYTTTADTSVSGYNAVSGREVGFFDKLYFPIVQTNCGPGGCWDTVLRVSNVGLDNNAAVTVRFFPADDGSGSLQTGFQVQALLDAGQTWSVKLSDWVPTGWVGSAQVLTDDAVVGIADRFKVGTDMWITNTAANAQAESFWQFPGGPANAPYVLFAPDVRTDWNGWNTGINVANTVDADNDVTIQYFGANGNAPAVQQRRLAAQGMTYFYNPSNPSQDNCDQPATDPPGCEFIGAAVILSTDPVAVAVDGVKYFGNDQNVGQAFSYAATGNAFTNLSAPLVQKGSPATGMGATSGINFLNPNAQATVVTTTWVNPSGFGASNFADSIVWVPAYSTGFVYTMFNNNLPNGFYGSAIVTSELPVAATTANVDYQVQGDGTVVWNLYNPCGFFRQSGFPADSPSCVYQGPVAGPVADATITKEVVCPDCAVANMMVSGAVVSYSGTATNGDAFNGSGVTGATGLVTFAVPAGTYTITLESLPATYDQSAVGQTETVTVASGNTATVTNTVSQAAVTKIVDTAVAGVTICVYPAGATIPADITSFEVDGMLPAGAIACAIADANGNATFTGLEAGVDYVAVVQGMGYDQVTDAFNIATPGAEETNEINLGAVPGVLTKAIDLGGFDFGVAFGQFSLNADVIFCKADQVDLDGDGVIDPTEVQNCDNFVTDPAAVAHGSYDSALGGSDFIFEFNAEVAPGDYVICSSAFVTGDFDADPTTPNEETVGYDYMCEATSVNQTVDGMPVTGPITVTSGMETYVTNDLEALAAGLTDVFVGDAAGFPLAGVTVNAYENGDTNGNGVANELLASAFSDANGYAQFNLPAGSYTFTALGTAFGGFEDQSATIDYTIAGDLNTCGLDDSATADPLCADVTLLLDPAVVPA